VPERERRTHWWSDRGSIRWIVREQDLAGAIVYVLEQQENPRRFEKSEV
jgi:hypothetical protein